MKYPVKYTVLSANRRKYTGKDKRIKWTYVCTVCKTERQGKEIEVDHITPAGSLKCYNDLPGFVERLFCSEDDLRVVCKLCHREITAKEKKNASKETN